MPTRPAAALRTAGLAGLVVLLLFTQLPAAPLAALLPRPVGNDVSGTDRPSPAIVRPSGSGASSDEASAGLGRAAPSFRPADPARPAPARPTASASVSASPSPSLAPPGPLVTDTISVSASVCPGDGSDGRVIFTRNPDLPDPVPGCRPAASGEISLLVTDPADRARVHDRVVVGSGGYAIAVVPVGQPFVLVVAGDDAGAAADSVSPVYRLAADRTRRQPITLRLFRVAGPVATGTTGTPAPADVDPAGTPGAGTPAAPASQQPITLLGVVCASETLAGTYAYVPGLNGQGTLPDATGTCRRATVGEMEFLLLDNTESSRLYDDALSGTDGVAVALAPVGRVFFVSEFQDDPDPDTGLASGSQAIVIPPDPAERQPIALTVIRYVTPGAVGLTAGMLFLSTVACPPGDPDPTLTVLGPDPSILLVPPGTAAGTPQPGGDPACEEAAADYRITPYGGADGVPIEVDDGADDGALIARLPATIAADGTRAFAPYELTELTTGATIAFDVQEGRYTSVRVVLVDAPATPAADSASDSATGSSSVPGPVPVGPGTAVASPGPGTPAAPTGVPTDPTAAPEPVAGDGAGLSPVRLLWAAMALLGIGVFLAGVWILRRPGGRRTRSGPPIRPG